MIDSPANVPAILNHRMQRCIGHGAYGEVWLALDASDLWTAVKILKHDPSGETRNYEQEIRGLKRYVRITTDRCLVQIRSSGQDADGRYFYYAMELADDAVTGLPLPLIDGEELAQASELAARYVPLTLKQRLKSGRLPPEECIRHGIALAGSLEYLHNNDLVHRDVKPSNIIMVAGSAKLADVGLVTNTDITLGSLAGTPEFVPIHGAGKPAGDIFALGKVLYLMANGRPLSDFPNMLEGWEDLLDEERRALAELCAVYDRACDEDPTARYPSAKALREDLERLRRDESVIQLQRREAEATRREAQLRRRRHALGVGMAIAAVAVLAAILMARRAETAYRSSLAALETRKLSRITRRVQGWAQSDWNAILETARGQPDEAVLLMAASTLSGLDAQRIGDWPNVEATAAAFSGDALLVCGFGDSRGAIMPTKTNRVELPIVGEGKVAWSSDAAPLFLQIERGKALLRDAKTGNVRRAFPIEPNETVHETHAPVSALSQDGTLSAAILSGNQTKRLAIWENRNGTLVGTTSSGGSMLAFAPDNSRLALGHEDGTVTLFRINPFETEMTLPVAIGPNPVQALAFGIDPLLPLSAVSGDTRWLLAVGDRATGIVIWELAGRRPRSFCRGSMWEVQSLAFHPDNTMLASAGRMGVQFWEVCTGLPLLWLDGHGSNTRALAFNRDGTRLAVGSTAESSNAEVRLWQLEPDRGIRRLSGLAAPVRRVVVSPNNQYVAALSDEWRLGVWEIRTGRLLHVFELAAAVYADSAGIAFDPENQFLAFAAGTSACLFDLRTTHTKSTWILPDGLSDQLGFDARGMLNLGRIEHDPGPPKLRRWCLYELPTGQPARKLHSQRGTNDTALNVTLTTDASRLLVLGKDRQSKSNHLSLINVNDGKEISRMPTGNASPWDVVRVDPTGTRCALGLGNAKPGQKSLLSMSDWQLIGDVGNCRALGPAGSLYATEGGEIIPLIPGSRSKKLFVATDGHSTSDTHIFSPDGSWFCWGTADGGVIVANLGEVERRLATIHNSEKSFPGKE